MIVEMTVPTTGTDMLLPMAFVLATLPMPAVTSLISDIDIDCEGVWGSGLLQTVSQIPNLFYINPDSDADLGKP